MKSRVNVTEEGRVGAFTFNVMTNLMNATQNCVAHQNISVTACTTKLRPVSAKWLLRDNTCGRGVCARRDDGADFLDEFEDGSTN